MDGNETSQDRRRLLQGATLGGLALLMGSCSRGEPSAAQEGLAESDDEFCLKSGSQGNPSDKEIADIARELWGAFDKGVLAGAKGTMELAQGVKQDREQYHVEIVKQNWSKIKRCRKLTRQCAFNAGVVAAVMTKSGGRGAITKETFVDAAAAVFEMQRYRAGDPSMFSGIAC